MTYQRKTKDEYVVQELTLEGWEEICREGIYQTAIDMAILYRNNHPSYLVKVKKVRIKL